MLPETFPIDSLGAYTNVSMTTDTLRTFQLFEDFTTINYKDCSEVKWSKDMTTLPTVSEARLLAFWTVLSAKTGGVESFSCSFTQSSFLQLFRSVLSLKGACSNSRRTSALTCGPYTLVSCDHHVTPSAEYTAFPSSEYSTPSISSCRESSYPEGAQ